MVDLFGRGFRGFGLGIPIGRWRRNHELAMAVRTANGLALLAERNILRRATCSADDSVLCIMCFCLSIENSIGFSF